MWGPILSITSGIGALILIYLLVSHPSAVTSITNATGTFAINESKVLQGR